MTAILRVIFGICVVFGGLYLLNKHFEQRKLDEVANTDLDKLNIALREDLNRLVVHRLSGTVSTVRKVRGGPGDLLWAELRVKQPYTQSYFVDMKSLTLKDYMWDQDTRTLTVRVPHVVPDQPNIDSSKQVVAQSGPIITRDMQARVRRSIAEGARKQVTDGARRPEIMLVATRAARSAISSNLEKTLAAVGVPGVEIVVRMPSDEARGDGERWDVSRSIDEVLRKRSTR